MKLELTYIGNDDWRCPVYKDQFDKLWKDIDLGNCEKPALHSSSNNDFDGEPDMPINQEYTLLSQPERNIWELEYRMLSRLKTDCDYFLGCGNRCLKHISGNSVETHVNEMRKLWHGFPEGQKPEWLTLEQIEEYEKQMIGDTQHG